MKYDEAGKPVINTIKRVSKLSRRVYAGVKDIHKVQRGYGFQVLTTPNGLLTNKEANKQKVGGEVICEIW